jgi:hypothetical protein
MEYKVYDELQQNSTNIFRRHYFSTKLFDNAFQLQTVHSVK